MYIIIRIHHASQTDYVPFASKQKDFLPYVKGLEPSIKTVDAALEWYTRDLRTYIEIKSKRAVKELLQYPTYNHRSFEVRDVAREILEKYY